MLRNKVKNDTKEIHKYVEKLPIMKAILSNSISSSNYLNYLIQLSYIYKSIESNKLYEKLEWNIKLYNNSIKDIKILSKDNEVIVPYSITTIYCNYLSCIDNIDILAGHAYVRYMADLMGGRILKKKIEKNFPTNVYDIENITDTKDKIIDYINKCVSDYKLFETSVQHSFSLYAAILQIYI